MDEGWAISIDLETTALAERLEDELTRLPSSFVARDGQSVLIRTQDEHSGRRADAIVMQFIAEHGPRPR